MSEPWKDEWISPCGSVRLLLGDCLSVLPTLEAGSVDCTVTSPPYNQKLDSFKASGFKAEGAAVWAERAASSYFDSIPEDDYQIQQGCVLNELHRVASSHGSLFYNHKCRWRDKVLLHPIAIVAQSRWKLRQEIIWSRDGSLTQNAKMFPPSEERIIWLFKDTWKWNADSNRFMSVWKIASEHYSEHPVAFPVDIPLRCIEAATESGDTILDPYAGSGTTLVAAVRLGRKAIGIEREPKYFAIARKRIEEELGRFPLFKEKPVETQAELFSEAAP